VSRGYNSNKRQREDARGRKQQDKARRRAEKREIGPQDIPVVSAADLMRDLPSVDDAMRALERRSSEPRAAATVPARLFVGGISDEVSEQELAEAFATIGPVADAVIVLDRDTRMSRGFGFVTMADRKDAPRAIETLDGADLKGRRIVVNVATERSR
jgi:hypothetical protein